MASSVKSPPKGSALAPTWQHESGLADAALAQAITRRLFLRAAALLSCLPVLSVMSVAGEDDSLDPSEEDKQLYGRALSFFADEHDARILIARLNADSEIAFIVPDGPRPSLLSQLLNTGHRQRWKAVQTADALEDGAHILWHVPAGALPLLGVEGPSTLRPPSDPPIPDPWAGWIEEWRGADPQIPYFGPNCPASIFLELWTRHRPYTHVERTTVSPVVTYWTQGYDVLVASGLQWGFGHWRPPPPQTLRWWNLLEIWMSQNALKLHDPIDPGVVFWAFPSALRKLKGGMRYEARGWNLDGSIRVAEIPTPKPR